MKHGMGMLCGACIVGLIACVPMFPLFVVLNVSYDWASASVVSGLAVAILLMLAIAIWSGLIAWALEKETR